MYTMVCPYSVSLCRQWDAQELSSMLSLALIVPVLLASGQVNAQFGQPTNANPFVDQVAIQVRLGVHLILIFYWMD